MDPLLEQLLLPWWKIIVYFGALVLGGIGIKVSLTFNVNTWMEERRKSKAHAEHRKRASKCGHRWTLYPNSVYSQCNLCLVNIPTSTLLAAEQFKVKPIILAKNHGVMINLSAGALVTTDYVGQRK